MVVFFGQGHTNLDAKARFERFLVVLGRSRVVSQHAIAQPDVGVGHSGAGVICPLVEM